MRILKFIVDGQTIKKDPFCEFDGLVPGTEKLVLAEFSFSKEWRDYKKVIEFRSVLGKEYEPQKLIGDRTCVIPSAALQKRAFKIRVIGKKGDVKLTTNKIEVKQTGGKA